MKKRLAWMALVLASGAGIVMACDFSDENPGSSSGTSGRSQDGSVSSGSGGGSSGLTPSSALCEKVGGAAAVKDVGLQVVSKLELDCRVGAHITLLSANSRAHFEQCFGNQLTEFLGCPGVKYAGSVDAKGQACRGMGQAHQNMTLRDADFKVYLQATVDVLKSKGLNDEDLAPVVGAVNGTYGAVVKVQNPEYHSKCTCPNDKIPGTDKACNVPIVNDAGVDAPADAPADAPTEGG